MGPWRHAPAGAALLLALILGGCGDGMPRSPPVSTAAGQTAPAATAAAQTAPAPPAIAGQPDKETPPDPAEIAKRQAMIDALPDGRKVFRIDEHGTVTHIQSGLQCNIPKTSDIVLLRLVIYPNVPAGDDVTCDYRALGAKTTLYATRASGTLQSYVRGTVAAIRQVHPGARPVDGPMFLSKEGDETRMPFAQSFAVEIDGRPMLTSVWISEERGWFVTVRSTYPEPRHDPEFMAAVMFFFAQAAVRQGPR